MACRSAERLLTRATGTMVYPYASAAAALLPNGQVLYAGGRKVKYCGQYYCDVRRMLSMARADMVASA